MLSETNSIIDQIMGPKSPQLRAQPQIDGISFTKNVYSQADQRRIRFNEPDELSWQNTSGTMHHRRRLIEEIQTSPQTLLNLG
jgi:hypothetical protein